MMKYCKFNLIRYRVWEGTIDNALGDASEENPKTVLAEQETFLKTEYALKTLTTVSKERCHLEKQLTEKLEDDEINEQPKPTLKTIPPFAALSISF